MEVVGITGNRGIKGIRGMKFDPAMWAGLWIPWSSQRMTTQVEFPRRNTWSPWQPKDDNPSPTIPSEARDLQ